MSYFNEKGQEYGVEDDWLLKYFTGVKSGERKWPTKMVVYSTAAKARIEAT